MSFNSFEFECKEQSDFEKHMSRFKIEFRKFDKIGEFTYSDDNTSIAYDCYLAGAASRQQDVDKLQIEIDKLQKQIDEALEKCCTGIRKQGGNYYLELIEDILKGESYEIN